MERFTKTNLSAFLNFLRAKYEAYTGAVAVESRPYYAMIDPCDRCQLRCPTCPTGIESEGRRRGDQADTTYRTDRAAMTPAMFDAALDDLGEHLFLIELHSWGEPLLNKHVPSFVRKAKARNVEVHMHTNLSLPLTDERIEDIAGCGLDFLFASIDGFSQEAYEKFRVGGDVELAKDNLVRLARARDRLGGTTAMIYKFLTFAWNEHEVSAAAQFARDAGLVFLPQDACVPDASWLPSKRRAEKPFLSVADVEALDRQWAAAGRAGYWKEHEKHAYWMPIEPDHQWVPTDGPRIDSFCGWHYSTAVIQPGGHLAPCCIPAKAEDRFGQIVPGAVGLAELWNGAPYRKSRAAFAGEPVAGLESTDTVCTRCYFPEPFKHVLSYNDFKVINQFAHAFGDADEALQRAFQLLSGGEDAANRARFVELFEQTLTSYFQAARPAP